MEFRRQTSSLPSQFLPVDFVQNVNHPVYILSYGENKAGLYAPEKMQRGSKNKFILPDNFVYVFFAICRKKERIEGADNSRMSGFVTLLEISKHLGIEVNQ